MPGSDTRPEFFIDRSLGRHIVPDALRRLDLVVHTMVDVYGPREQVVSDAEWLGHAGAMGWVVLTKDEHIRRRSHEVAAMAGASVRVFCLSSAKLVGTEQARRFVDNIQRIEAHLREPGPWLCMVYEHRVVRVWPPSGVSRG